jgi:hypothetical protein
LPATAPKRTTTPSVQLLCVVAQWHIVAVVFDEGGRPVKRKTPVWHLAAGLLLIGGMLVAGAPAAAAPPRMPWPHNGCTSPHGNAPAGVSFKRACDVHDGCYSRHWSSRKDCDTRFLIDMQAVCDDADTIRRGLTKKCLWAAKLYYTGVRKFGATFYHLRSDPTLLPHQWREPRPGWVVPLPSEPPPDQPPPGDTTPPGGSWPGGSWPGGTWPQPVGTPPRGPTPG